MSDDQPSTSAQPAYREGRVKFYNRKNGFGYILDLDTNDEFFVHATGISPNSDSQSRVLHDGEYVRFQTRPDDRNEGKNDICWDVTGLRGGPLLCDSNSRVSKNSNNNSRRKRDSSA